LLKDVLCVHFAIAFVLMYRMLEIWRLLSLVWSLGLLLGGCASAPRVKVAAEVFDSEKAKSRSVAVVADLYMDDPAEADKLAELMRGQLVVRGFKVQETENEADLVIVPTIERSKPTSTVATPLLRAWHTSDLAYGLGQANMTESQNALRNLGFGFGPSGPAPEQSKAGLMITAVSRDVWFKALMNEKVEIPRVWRIIAVIPWEKEDVTPKLVEAVASKLDEVAGGKTAETEKTRPTPSASTQQKPGQ
jgi:hypothetical protein